MLELQGLRKRFGEVTALDDVGFTVEPGLITGFLGRNGAGKSTTMRSIFGLVNLDAGTVAWNGRPVDQEVMTRFGFMPEQRGLYKKMKVADQVAWFARLKGMTKSAAEAAGADLLGQLGLGDRLDDKLEQLSHGNQQRVQLATALVHQPDLCVLDEPFNGLDPTAVRVLNGQLRELADRGRAVLFSSHQLDLIEELCDRVVIIDHGRVRATGSVNDVRRALGYRTLEVAYDVAPDWNRLPVDGISLTGTRSATIRLDDDAQLDQLLGAAAEAGPLATFSYDLPSLSDVFAEVTA